MEHTDCGYQICRELLKLQITYSLLSTESNYRFEQVLVTGKRGTLVAFNAHLWHGGEPNNSDKKKTSLHMFFTRRDKPQQQRQCALVPEYKKSSLSPTMRWLLAADDCHADPLRAGRIQPGVSGAIPTI